MSWILSGRAYDKSSIDSQFTDVDEELTVLEACVDCDDEALYEILQVLDLDSDLDTVRDPTERSYLRARQRTGQIWKGQYFTMTVILLVTSAGPHSPRGDSCRAVVLPSISPQY